MGKKIQIVMFEIENQAYGINIFSLDEIIPMLEVKPIPHGPKFLEGVINLRGEIIPVVDIKKEFGHKRDNYTFETRIIIAGFNSRKVGFIVDGVREIKDLEEDSVYGSVVASEHASFTDGMAKLEIGKLVQLIAIDRILDKARLDQLSEMRTEQ